MLPIMGMSGMMQSKDGHGQSAQGASSIEGLDHANDNMEKHQDGDATEK